MIETIVVIAMTILSFILMIVNVIVIGAFKHKG